MTKAEREARRGAINGCVDNAKDIVAQVHARGLRVRVPNEWHIEHGLRQSAQDLREAAELLEHAAKLEREWMDNED